jgi:gliding motility-associated-like protein
MKRIILPILAFLISHFSIAQVCSKAQLPTNLQNGLVAFYPFCGNANDLSGNGNNGTVNGATLTTDRFGNANSAYYFSGASCNTYIQATVNTSSIQTGVTISVWVNRSGDGCSNPRLFEFWPGSDGPSQVQWQWSNPNAIAMGHRTSTGVYLTTEVPAPSVNVWTHLVYTNDGSNAKFYRDGQLVATLASSGNPTLASNLAIGRMNHASWDAFNGKIDDFIVYNRALSSNEVSQLFSITSDPCSISSNVPSAPALNYLPYGTTVAGGNGSGSAANQFNIVDVAIDLPGNIYVADVLNHRIQKWAPGANSGITVAGGNGQGSAANQFNIPNGVALDRFGNIYVGDSDNNRVQKWVPGANSGITVAGGNGAGFAPDQLFGPSGLAIDSDGNIYIADFHNNRIQKWAPGANSGITVAGGNGAGSASNQFDGPISVAIDAYGNIFVADYNNHRIQKWNLGANSGITVAGGNNAGPAANQLNAPSLVTIDAAGNIYIADANNHRIQKWIPGAATGITLAGGNGAGSTLDKIDTPLGVTFDFNRNFYVADAGNYRVQKWSQQDTITLCLGSTASALVANADAGNTLRWYGTNATGGTASSSATIPSTTTAGIFNYYVSQVSTATGCESPRTRITVVVNGFSYNPLTAQRTICGPSTTLDAGSGYTSYLWSTGATSQTITATSSGEYRVTVTNASGCVASDTTSVNIIKSDILQNSTTICKGTSITLSVDSSFAAQNLNNINLLPSNLKAGLKAYYPFSGNANDASGNNNNGTVTGATLTTDRFGNANSAYSFNGSSFIDLGNIAGVGYSTTQDITTSFWINEGASGTVISKYTNLDAGNSNFFFSKATTTAQLAGNGTNSLTASNLNDNRWANYVFIASAGANKSFLYRNGVLVATGTLNANGALSATKIMLGKLMGSPSNFFTGKIDDVFIYNRALTVAEIAQLSNFQPKVTWSNGATTNTISVTPTATTKYYATVSDGITSCIDSVTVTVDDIGSFNPLPVQSSTCGITKVLDAGAGFSSYLWNTGATSQTISPTINGEYIVTVTSAAGCSASDTVSVSLIKADIIQTNQTVCAGTTINLFIDSTFSGSVINAKSQMSASLQTGLVAYYPFNGNATDISGNNNVLTANGVTLTTDRFGRSNSAYSFTNTQTSVTNYLKAVNPTPFAKNTYTISAWFNSRQFYPNIGGVTYNYQSIVFYSPQWYTYGPAYHLALQHANNSILEGGNWTTTNTNQGVTTANGSIVVNQWYHVVLSYDGTNIKMYKDGQLVGSRAATISYANQIQFLIGGAGDGPSPGGIYGGFNGKIDDVGFWDRALTTNEIQELYNGRPSVLWSTSETTNKISVTPAVTTKYYATLTDGIATCTDSVTITVDNLSAFNPLQDTVKVCGDSIILDAGAGYTTYRWSNGATTRTITAKISGKYFVNVASAAGCSASDTSVISIVNANIIQSDTTICKGSNISLSVDDSKIFYNSDLTKILNFEDSNLGIIDWTVGSVQISSGLIGNGIKLFNAEAYSQVKTKDAAFGYGDYEVDTKAGSYVADQYLSVLLPSGMWNSEAILIDSRPNGTDNVGWAVWVKGVRVAMSAGTNPANYLDWYKLKIRVTPDSVKCWINSTLLFEGVNSGILPNIGAIKLTNYDLSYFDNLKFVPYSPKASILWSTGATTPSIVVNPTVKTTYKVTVSDGITTCTDSIVVDVSSSELKLTNPAAVCSPSFVNLRDAAVTAGSAAGLTFTYWKDANATQALANPDRVSVSGTYYIVGTSATGCTSAPTAVKVTVNPLPVAAIVTPTQTTICDKNTLILTATGGTNYQWLYNGAAIAGATDSTYAATLGGSYEVNVIALGCTTKVAAPVNLSLIKAAIPKFSNSSTCMDVPVSFFNETDTASSGSVNYIWDFGDGQTSTMFNPVYTYKKTGAFIVKLTVTPKQCSSLPASFTKNITVDIPPVGIKYPNVLAVKNKATNLSARFIANGYTYLWMPATGLNNGAIQNPVFNASIEQLYRVRLTSAGGCITMDTVKVSVYDSSDIFVPKAFTPNKDGKNDLLQPFLVNITTLKFFRVYNRWGQLMFQTSDSKQGWDGMYNYKPQPLETYTWIAEGVDSNGATIFRKGQTALIR